MPLSQAKLRGQGLGEKIYPERGQALACPGLHGAQKTGGFFLSDCSAFSSQAKPSGYELIGSSRGPGVSWAAGLCEAVNVKAARFIDQRIPTTWNKNQDYSRPHVVA